MHLPPGARRKVKLARPGIVCWQQVERESLLDPAQREFYGLPQTQERTSEFWMPAGSLICGGGAYVCSIVNARTTHCDSTRTSLAVSFGIGIFDRMQNDTNSAPS